MAPTAAMSSMSQPVKDNRPIRDKQFQILEQKQIIKFLAEAQFPGNITMKTLQSPTSKDFQTVFRWLFEILDPCYVLCKGNKKFDDEIIPTLKYHRYPAADQINIKWMQAVGSMHAWPSMLAVLHWMTLLCIVRSPGILKRALWNSYI
jgi:kinetochore protein NDC80